MESRQSRHTLIVFVLWMKFCQFSDGLDTTLTCSDRGTVFVDGQYRDMFHYTRYLQLPDDASLFAIQCQSSAKTTSAGLIASFSNGMVSNHRWKCSVNKRENGWFLTDFDDSKWKMVNEITSFTEELNGTIDGVEYPAAAKWIWRRSNASSSRSESLYCRVHLGTIKARVRCDDVADIYVDGSHVYSTTWWNEVWQTSLSHNVIMLAIKCRNIHGGRGIIASFSNGIISDGRWKCGYPEDGWNEVGFDDSSWGYATEVTDEYLDWNKRSAFPEEAKWIWTSNVESDEIVCCRVKLHGNCVGPVHDGINPFITPAFSCMLALTTTGCSVFAVLYCRQRARNRARRHTPTYPDTPGGSMLVLYPEPCDDYEMDIMAAPTTSSWSSDSE